MKTMTHLGLVLAPLACWATGAQARAEGGTIQGTVTAIPAKYLEETVVYLKEVPGSYAPEKQTMDQKGLQFIPHVLVITKGDTVTFLNHDSVAHNVFSPDNEGYNLGTFNKGDTRSYTFEHTGVYAQLCSIHPDMLAYIFVGQNPYAAHVDAKGHYEIEGVPGGTFELAVWNSHLKAAPKKVSVAAGKTSTADFVLER